MSEDNKALVRYEGAAVAAPSIYDRIADPMAAVERMGAWLAKSRMLGIETAEQGCVVAMTCMQERITPLEFKRRYHVIKGTPSMRADYMQAEFQRCGGRVRWDKTDETECVLTLLHPSQAPEGFTVEVKLADLRKRGIATPMYDKFPRQMLRARAISEAVRAVMPSINAGTYTPEEVESFDEGPRYAPPEASPLAAAHQAPPAEATSVSASPAPAKPTNGKTLAERTRALTDTLQRFGLVLEDATNLVGAPVERWDEEAWTMVREAVKKVGNAAPADRQRVAVAAFNLQPDAFDGPGFGDDQQPPPPEEA